MPPKATVGPFWLYPALDGHESTKVSSVRVLARVAFWEAVILQDYDVRDTCYKISWRGHVSFFDLGPVELPVAECKGAGHDTHESTPR